MYMCNVVNAMVAAINPLEPDFKGQQTQQIATLLSFIRVKNPQHHIQLIAEIFQFLKSPELQVLFERGIRNAIFNVNTWNRFLFLHIFTWS